MNTIAPWLSVADAEKAVGFYKAAFGAIELHRLEEDNGRLAVAQLSVDGAGFWVQDDPVCTPDLASRSTFRMIMTVEDPDLIFGQALAVGAVEVAPVHEGHGWRIGRLIDPFGYQWEVGRKLG